ncbi:MAG TPA: stage III sporulation protein AD [Clostridiales bacterium]|nr:stage III sporulation protein AD [Clostridiales bacterium]
MEVSQLFTLVGVGLVAMIMAVTLRQYRPEFALLVSLVAGVVILIGVVRGILPVVEQVQTIFQSTQMPAAYLQVLFKALGICFLTQIACDACRDAGEGAIGAKVELAGKVAVLVISLPLFVQVLTIVRGLLV